MSSPPIPYPRRNGSVSSNSHFNPPNLPNPASVRASGSSQSTRSSTAPSVNPFNSSHMESTVTRLLVATKQLLESLTDWSQGKIDEGGVSDIYVRLGNEFNAASLAFTKEGINMSDLNSVPDDLRTCLEAALSEEASPSTLDQHLPQIRQIVVHLLQGLKVKQAKWRAAKRQHETEASYSNRPSSIREHGNPPDRPSVPHPSIRSGPRSLNAPKSREDLRRVAVVSTSSQNDHHRSQPPQAFNPSTTPHPFSRSLGPSDSSNNHKTNDGPTLSRSPGENTATSSFATSKSRMSPVSRAVRTVNDISDRLRGNKVPPPPAPPPPPPIPPHSDPSLASYRTDNIPLPPVPHSPRSDSSNQAQASSLEALRKAEMLQRRASKRFSTYTYNKIAATASPHKRSGESQNNLGLGSNVPALPRSPIHKSFLSPRDDAESARETSQAGRELLQASSSQRSQDGGHSTSDHLESASRPGSRTTENEDSFDQGKDNISTITEETTQQSIRINPMTPDSLNALTNVASTSPHSRKIAGSSAANKPDHPCTIFLQLGRDVKKATLDSTPTIASLRVLFMDRFQFNPGSGSFPEIYLRDPQSGIQYQLEDMSEVKDRVVLSLNIDALDQVKTHIDSGLTSLAREIKDLKSSITTLRRQSIPPPPPMSNQPVLKPSSRPPTPIQPASESQFKQTARQVIKSSETTATSRSMPKMEPSVGSDSPRPPDSASSSSDLRLQQLNGTFKNQYGEVQALRRDLGILRQLYGTFTGETKSLLAGLRSQAEAVKQAATAKVASSRTFIDVGKVKLESQSQDLVTKVESLQDTVEDLKQDVTNRKMKPKPSTMATVSQSIQTVKAELEQLTTHITTIKPAWKKSWEDELQTIVDEQQLLNYQEDLIKDLKEDLEAVSNLFGHVEHYLDVRKVSKVKPKEFNPMMTSPTGTGAIYVDPRGSLETVLMQVKGLEPNQESRLKAIEAAEKLRAKNLEEVSKENEFAQELAGFVGKKKLKMTGGHEEIERMRKMKSEMTLKALTSSSPANSPVDPSSTATEQSPATEITNKSPGGPDITPSPTVDTHAPTVDGGVVATEEEGKKDEALGETPDSAKLDEDATLEGDETEKQKPSSDDVAVAAPVEDPS
ncbi:hypothetical protein PCASD_23770 [Puccinia coronata f. sp. avenae]|uniref:Actin interacting protein 3 C-terminal domain-containing protein n=1 Tax=Puccinia coronata f. sp. avenae TaxID=200324 RepID=A0A2N5S6J0_9BASI|nr:hypothetical protein PCASD_23770 [Puccinia coronata f. sp. avenae]